MPESKRYTVTVVARDGRVYVPVPFDPDEVWATRTVHHVAGTVDGKRVRGEVEAVEDGRAFVLGPAWRPDLRRSRIEETIQLLKAGHKQRPGQ